MDDETPHEIEYLGTTCDECGTHHRILEKLDNRPLTRSAVDSLRKSESIEFIRGVMKSASLVDIKASEKVTENIILSTAGSTVVVSRYDEHGWVVEKEIEHEDDDDPEEVGEQTWTTDAVPMML
ncbi:hypothetical protein ACLI4Z_13715 [Natrialbaceae archaeon A-arb3/5]